MVNLRNAVVRNQTASPLSPADKNLIVKLKEPIVNAKSSTSRTLNMKS